LEISRHDQLVLLVRQLLPEQLEQLLELALLERRPGLVRKFVVRVRRLGRDF
jgi:hypothetical protein